MATFLFNFKREFVPDVESGKKRQTIRQTRKDKRRPVPGDIAKCYTGLRTRNTRLLRTSTVEECLAVRMHFDDGVIVIDGRKLEMAEAGDFARADGFPSVSNMLRWFKEQYGPGDFEGFCALWAVEA